MLSLQQGFPGGDIDLMEEVDSASDISTDEMDDEDADEDEELFLDPRAGRADTVLPPVDFQPSDIVHLLSTTKMNQQRTLAARQSKSISSLIDKYVKIILFFYHITYGTEFLNVYCKFIFCNRFNFDPFTILSTVL